MLTEVDRSGCQAGAEQSLYLRPLMFGTESCLGVRPSQKVRCMLIA